MRRRASGFLRSVLVLVVLVLAGCSSRFVNKPEDVGVLDEGYKELVVDYLVNVEHSRSDVYIERIDEARLGHCQVGAYGPFHGWMVPVDYRVMNKYGAWIRHFGIAWIAGGVVRKFTDDDYYCG